MVRRVFLVLLLLLPALPAGAQDTCRLCYSDPATRPGERPLRLEIFADLSFSKLAQTGAGGGSATLGPEGGKQTSGGIIDLGGMAVSGHGRITGEPGREVRVELPDRVPMSAADGSDAELVQFTTSLPRHPELGPDGSLEFSFGARLVVKGKGGGNYRGRIPISVDYN